MDFDLLSAALDEARPIILRRYTNVLYRLSHYYEAEDLFQEVAAKATRHAAGCRADTIDGVRNWVLSIASRTCKTLLLKAGKTNERYGATLDFDVKGDTLSDSLEVGGDVSRMRDCLDRLPPTQREAVEMRYLQNCSYAEISDRLQVSLEAARIQVCNGLKSLRSEWDQPSLFVAE